MNKLRFYGFNLMPYPYIPPTEEFESTWVSLSNKYYEPQRGRRLYNEYIDQLVAAEKYGFDGVGVNEHHANFYGTMPSPNIIAAMLVARTEHIPIGVIGNAIPLHGNPLRVAEEIAMLDVISGGRIISGFVRGIGCEYFNNGVVPSDSVGRFNEAHDLIIKAWTDDGPFTWQGDHFYIPNVNPIPRPIQDPHPPIWIPGQGSLETLQFVAKHKYTYMMVFAPQWFTKLAFDGLREECNRLGYEAPKTMVNASVPTYVAETDEQAHREAKAHLSWVFNTGLKIPDQIFFPPGYMTTKSFRNFMGALQKGHGRILRRRWCRRAAHGWFVNGAHAELDGHEEHANIRRGSDAGIPRSGRQAGLSPRGTEIAANADGSGRTVRLPGGARAFHRHRFR
jgi:alkanesulfonate monooxygenase SsuD/methylene tetrahydromethanopterin reductase-like flavin-dependent oxidoreductase (luciferase family)